MPSFKLLLQNLKRPGFDLALIVALVVLVLLVVSGLRFNRQKERPLLSYLAPDAIFYVHNHSALRYDQTWVGDFIDPTFKDGYVTFLSAVFGQQSKNIAELTYFQRSGQPDSDYYLVRYSQSLKPLIKDLKNNQPALYYKDLGANVLLISDQDLSSLWPLDLVKADSENILAQNKPALDIFFAKNNQKWLVADKRDWLDSVLTEEQAVLSFYTIGQHKVIDLQQKNNQKNNIFSWSEVSLPKNADTILALSQNPDSPAIKNVKKELLGSLFSSLPQSYLLTSVEADRNRLIWQKNNDWLQVQDNNWLAELGSLAKNVALTTKKSRLADGTVYEELVADASQIKTEDYNGQTITNFGDLWLRDTTPFYYLSNNKDLLQATLDNRQNLSAYWQECSYAGPLTGINDLVYIYSNKTSGDLSTVLAQAKISQISLFSYISENKQGLKLCWQ